MFVYWFVYRTYLNSAYLKITLAIWYKSKQLSNNNLNECNINSYQPKIDPISIPSRQKHRNTDTTNTIPSTHRLNIDTHVCSRGHQHLDARSLALSLAGFAINFLFLRMTCDPSHCLASIFAPSVLQPDISKAKNSLGWMQVRELRSRPFHEHLRCC